MTTACESVRRAASLLLGLVVVTSIAACSSRAENVMQQGEDQTVRVTVQNNDFRDAAIYAEWNSVGRRRVGMVTGKTSETFTMQWQSEVVRFDVDFVPGSGFTSDAIDVYEGDHLDFVIQNQGNF